MHWSIIYRDKIPDSYMFDVDFEIGDDDINTTENNIFIRKSTMIFHYQEIRTIEMTYKQWLTKKKRKPKISS